MWKIYYGKHPWEKMCRSQGRLRDNHQTVSDIALTLSKGEREGRSSRWKCFRLQCGSKKSLVRSLRSPWAKVIHQRRKKAYPKTPAVLSHWPGVVCGKWGLGVKGDGFQSLAWISELNSWAVGELYFPQLETWEMHSRGRIPSWPSTTYKWRMILQSKKKKRKEK